MARNDVFGKGFQLDTKQLNYKLQVISGCFVHLMKSGIMDTATDEQKRVLSDMFMILDTYNKQIQNDIEDSKAEALK